MPGLSGDPYVTLLSGNVDTLNRVWSAYGVRVAVGAKANEVSHNLSLIHILPSVFNPVMGDPKLHVGLMLTSFFVSGLLFWLQFIPSRPWRPTLTPFARVGALLVTNLVMTIVAMSLSFLASGPFYDIGNSMLHMANMASMTPTTLNPFADQQIGAAILWVCGDFWCYPAIVMALRLATKNLSLIHIYGTTGREVQEVHGAAGQTHEFDVAQHHQLLGERRASDETEATTCLLYTSRCV